MKFSIQYCHYLSPTLEKSLSTLVNCFSIQTEIYNTTLLSNLSSSDDLRRKNARHSPQLLGIPAAHKRQAGKCALEIF